MSKGNLNLPTRIGEADQPPADFVSLTSKKTVAHPGGEFFFKGDDNVEFPLRGESAAVVINRHLANAVSASTANISIVNDLEPGDLIAGVTLADGDIVAVFGQTDQSENGIYTVTVGGGVRVTVDHDGNSLGGEYKVGDYINVNRTNDDAGRAGYSCFVGSTFGSTNTWGVVQHWDIQPDSESDGVFQTCVLQMKTVSKAVPAGAAPSITIDSRFDCSQTTVDLQDADDDLTINLINTLDAAIHNSTWGRTGVLMRILIRQGSPARVVTFTGIDWINEADPPDMPTTDNEIIIIELDWSDVSDNFLGRYNVFGAAGVAAGNDTEVQFNSAGVLGASANLTYSGTTLNLGGASPRLDVIATSGEAAFIRIGEDLATPMVLEFDGSGSDKGLHLYGTTPGKNTSLLIERDTNIVRIRDPKSSTSTTTGALTVVGGVGIGGSQHIGADLFVNGNVNITGGVCNKPVVVSVSGTTVLDDTKTFIYADPATAAGNIVLQMPDASTCVGQLFSFKRITNSVSKVSIETVGGQLIDSTNVDRFFGFQADAMQLQSVQYPDLSHGWETWARRSFCFVAYNSMSDVLATQGLSSGVQEVMEAFNDAGTNVTTTPGRTSSDQANHALVIDRIDNVADTYRVIVSAIMTGSNNVSQQVELFKNTVATGVVGQVETSGGNDPATAVIDNYVIITAADLIPVCTLDLRITADSNNTLRYRQGTTFTLERIGG